MARLRPHIGDVFAIPLDDHGYGAAVILHLSTYFKDGMLIGIFRIIAPTIQDIDITCLNEFLETPNYTSKKIITKGDCPVIGNRLDLVQESRIPILRCANELFFRDEIIGRPSSAELDQYPTLLGMGFQSVKNRIIRAMKA